MKIEDIKLGQNVWWGNIECVVEAVYPSVVHLRGRDTFFHVNLGGIYMIHPRDEPPKPELTFLSAKKLLEDAGYTVQPPAPKRSWWVNLYAGAKGYPTSVVAHASKAEADEGAADMPRLACIHFTEGDGL